MWSAELQNNSLETPQVSQSSFMKHRGESEIGRPFWASPDCVESNQSTVNSRPGGAPSPDTGPLSATAVERCKNLPLKDGNKDKISPPGERLSPLEC